MTRKLRRETADDGRSRKRILKPVVEKKRRDRINQSLAELRSLLLRSSCDPRLQNPKIEKAEILDLAVEFLRRWTDRKNRRDDCSGVRTPLLHLAPAEPGGPAVLGVEAAGFQRCASRLAGYMSRMSPPQRAGLLEGLRRHADFTAEMPEASDGVGMSDSRLLLQPLSCSTPCHDYLSPPSSPWLSPPFPSFSCHFSPPPSLSPPSSNTSFFSVSPSFPHTNPLGSHAPPPTSLIPPSHPAHRGEAAPHSPPATWRPWL